MRTGRVQADQDKASPLMPSLLCLLCAGLALPGWWQHLRICSTLICCWCCCWCWRAEELHRCLCGPGVQVELHIGLDHADVERQGELFCILVAAVAQLLAVLLGVPAARLNSVSHSLTSNILVQVGNVHVGLNHAGVERQGELLCVLFAAVAQLLTMRLSVPAAKQRCIRQAWTLRWAGRSLMSRCLMSRLNCALACTTLMWSARASSSASSSLPLPSCSPCCSAYLQPSIAASAKLGLCTGPDEARRAAQGLHVHRAAAIICSCSRLHFWDQQAACRGHQQLVCVAAMVALAL